MGHRARMGLLWLIAALPTIPSQLAADGRWMSIHYSGDLALIMSGFIEDSNLVRFDLGEMCVVHSWQLCLGGLGGGCSHI